MKRLHAICILFSICYGTLSAQQSTESVPASSLLLSDIQLRDPYLVANQRDSIYYLFGTNFLSGTDMQVQGFDLYASRDLIHWQGPDTLFRAGNTFWGDRNFWAPECHAYRGKYYLFATFRNKQSGQRGTGLLQAKRIGGPYRPHTRQQLTPPAWSALDGTLYLDKKGKPWMVFCHEWTQIGDGTVAAIRLSRNLKKALGEPITLFAASQAPWVKSLRPDSVKNVTDGPFLFRNSKGELMMLWSSFGTEGYAIGIAHSSNGEIDGPWAQFPDPLFQRDGGHGMLIRTFDNRILLTIHQSNQGPRERPQLFLVEENADGIPVITERITPEPVLPAK